MIILHFQNVSISRTSNLRLCPPYRSLISRTSAWEAICLSFSSKKNKTCNCWSQVYRAVHYKLEKTTNISRHAIFRVTSQSVSPGYNFSGLPASSSISSGKRSQPWENTRVSESGKAFLSPFLALAWVASFRVPLARDFSRYSDDIYPPTEDLVAGNNISCNILFL